MSKGSRRGFTLIELSVVLAIIATITGAALVVLVGGVQAAAVNTTVARMNAISAALLDYRVAFNRLPCPADLTQLATSSTYGFEAGAGTGSSIAVGTGACTGTGMLPQANFTGTNGGDTVAEGGVPTRALRLPDSYMYDAWGRRFNYAVDVTMTATGAFTTTSILPAACATAAISVTDASDTAGSRTASAIYALVSHGANGHGGYSSSGIPLKAGSVNADEQTNCHCNSSAVAATYTPTYVEKLPTVDTANALDNFDDIVTFRTLWQMQTQNTTETVGKCQYLALCYTNNSTANVGLYLWNASSAALTKLTDPAVGAIGGGGYPPYCYPYFSYDNSNLVLLANVTNSNYSYGSDWQGIDYTVGTSGLTWATNFIQTNYPYSHLAVSRWANLAALAAYVNSQNTTYEWTGVNPSTYTSANYSSSNLQSALMDFAPDGKLYLVSNYALNIYSMGAIASPVYTYDISSALTFGANGALSVHPSGNYVAFASAYANSAAKMGSGSNQSVTQGSFPVIMKNPEGSYTWVNGQGSAGDAFTSVSWSPNGNYLATGGAYHSSVQIYYFATTPTESVTALFYDTTCGVTVGNLAWSSDSVYLAAVGSSGTCFYKRSGTGASATFSAVTPSGATFPSGVSGFAFSNAATTR